MRNYHSSHEPKNYHYYFSRFTETNLPTREIVLIILICETVSWKARIFRYFFYFQDLFLESRLLLCFIWDSVGNIIFLFLKLTTNCSLSSKRIKDIFIERLTGSILSHWSFTSVLHHSQLIVLGKQILQTVRNWWYQSKSRQSWTKATQCMLIRDRQKQCHNFKTTGSYSHHQSWGNVGKSFAWPRLNSKWY